VQCACRQKKQQSVHDRVEHEAGNELDGRHEWLGK
jgi:hypothetical protein